MQRTRLSKNKTFGRNIPTEICGPPPEYPAWQASERKGMGKDERVKREKIGRCRIISTSPIPFYGLPRRLPPEGIPNIPVRGNQNGRSIRIPTEISRIFGVMESTLSQVGVPKEAASQARLPDSHNHLKKPDCETC